MDIFRREFVSLIEGGVGGVKRKMDNGLFPVPGGAKGELGFSRARACAWVVFLPLLWAVVIAGAQAAQDSYPFRYQLAEWQFVIDRAAAVDDGSGNAHISRLRRGLERVAREANAVADEAREQVKRTQALLEAVGPSPAEGEAAEEASVARERLRLRHEFGVGQGREKQAELVAAKAGQAQDRLASLLDRRRTKLLFHKAESALDWRIWARAPEQLIDLLAVMAATPKAALVPVFERAGGDGRWLGIVMLVLLVFAMGWALRAWLLRRFGRRIDILEPSFPQRLRAAIVVGVARGLLPSMVLGLPLVLSWMLIPPEHPIGLFGRLLAAGLLATILVVAVLALGRAALAPNTPHWRVVRFVGAPSIFRRIQLLAVVVALDVSAGLAFGEVLEVPDELNILQRFLVDTTLAALLASLTNRSLWRREGAADESEQAGRSRFWRSVCAGIVAAAVAIPVTAVLGYHNLSRFLAVETLLFGFVGALVVLLHALVDEVITLLLRHEGGRSVEIRKTLGIEEKNFRVLRFWLMLALDGLLIAAGMLALMPTFGFTWTDITTAAATAFGGFKIGAFRFAVGDILLAVLLFVVLMSVTRWLQRFLETRVLPQTRLDQGVRHSVKTALGYVGLVMAGMVAVSTLGWDLSNIAIIAGALSVGIGFGLQNMVSNFVSGLVLLVERPIKIGDWIRVGDQEGFVKRINVRATEMDTFQNASVIIPNSELISSPVVNWTHHDRWRRVDVPVGVAYGSDVDKVRAVLLACADRHEQVLISPMPFVLFMNFGVSSLDFELRFFVSRADVFFKIASDVRFSIDDEFRAAGIAIPFPQRTVHFPNTGPVRPGDAVE